MINFDDKWDNRFILIPRVLKELRNKAGITTKQLSKATGLLRKNAFIEQFPKVPTGFSPVEIDTLIHLWNDTVFMIESGSYNLINEDTMEKILTGLEISKQDFCNLVETEYEKIINN